MLIIFTQQTLQGTLTKKTTGNSVEHSKKDLDLVQLSPVILLPLFKFHVINLILKQSYTSLFDFLHLPLGKEKEKWTSIDKDGMYR